ncbi:exported protein of unknown function [Streptomyces sp. KY70]|nr:exported protein of unknown function [Streptomyces sp. KY70]
MCAPSLRIAERRYPFTVSGRRPSWRAAAAFVAPAATHATTSTSRGASCTSTAAAGVARAPDAEARRPQTASSASRSAGSATRCQRAQLPVGLAYVLPRARSRARTGRRLLPGQGQQLPDLVADRERLLHIAGRRDRRVEGPVPEAHRRTQRPVQHAPHRPPYDDGDRDHRAQPLRRHRRVVLVADVARGGVVRHRAGPGERDGLAAEAAPGRDDQTAQRAGPCPVQLSDPRVAGIGQQAAERDRQPARAAQSRQRRPHLDRIDRFRHSDAFPPGPRRSPVRGSGPPPSGGGETWVTVYMMLSDPSGPQ